MKKINLLLLALILAACSAGSTFDKNFARWEGANITHYRYTLSISCYCAFRDEMPLAIEVENDEVVSITSMHGNVIDSANSLYEVLEPYATMDRLFVILKDAFDGDADEISVLYDEDYGFPASMAIDQIKEAVDDEIFISVENFEILD